MKPIGFGKGTTWIMGMLRARPAAGIFNIHGQNNP